MNILRFGSGKKEKQDCRGYKFSHKAEFYKIKPFYMQNKALRLRTLKNDLHCPPLNDLLHD
jgi:hypothetical protein